MKIEVKIISKEENSIWSLPVAIDKFITSPNEIEFEWEDGSTLPYDDFIFFGGEYYYGIFINDRNINELKESDIK